MQAVLSEALLAHPLRVHRPARLGFPDSLRPVQRTRFTRTLVVDGGARVRRGRAGVNLDDHGT